METTTTKTKEPSEQGVGGMVLPESFAVREAKPMHIRCKAVEFCDALPIAL